ncbi:MAG: hypothetical protein LBI67_05505 [Treponema sp.]|jgi:hypothetical protein|nr:hypothetical protein [Treponema sp.]
MGGREVKRVPLDLDWPIGRIWDGYINPYQSINCEACDETGLNAKTKKLLDEWYNFNAEPDYVDLGNGRRYDRKAHCHNITLIELNALLEAGRLKNLATNGRIPTLEEVNRWSIEAPMGHDSTNAYICVEAAARAKGVYGLCPVCGGDGEIFDSEEMKKLAEDFEPRDPPDGEGYQLWETVSEGSPQSPVFETLDALVAWCSENATIFADIKGTPLEWNRFFENGCNIRLRKKMDRVLYG